MPASFRSRCLVLVLATLVLVPVTVVLALVVQILASGSARATTEEYLDASLRDGEILLARYPAPSPDGRLIAFSYQGDLWIVSSEGGEARRLTADAGRESYPVWSPDGEWIAFSSNRDGNDDVYVIPPSGGVARRLTWHSASDFPTDWTPDSRAVLFQTVRLGLDGWNREIFIVPLDGGNPAPLLPTGGRLGKLSPDGRRLAYLRGSVPWWRVGYEGNAKYRIWTYEMDRPLTGAPFAEESRPSGGAPGDSIEGLMGVLAPLSLRPGGAYTNLTAFASDEGTRQSYCVPRVEPIDWERPDQEFGVNSNPSWFPDGRHLLYLSEIHGVSNLKVLSVEDGKRAWLTRFEDGRLRFPQLSRDGRLVAFEYEDGIYTVRVPEALPPPGSSEWPVEPPRPERLRIRIPMDEKTPIVDRLAVRGGASEMELSPDSKQIVFVAQGDLFAMKADKDEPFAQHLTADPARDFDVAWFPDSKAIVFVSDRTGNRDLYTLRSADKDEPRLARTLHPKLTRLTDDARDEQDPRISPDGERIAYRRGNGTLMVMKADGSEKTVLVDGWSEIQFEWSPDSRWLAYARDDNDFNSDVFIISADGKTGPYNISQHPANDYSPYWSKDGKLLAFVSERGNIDQTDIWYVRLSLEDEELSREDRLDEIHSEDADKDQPKKKGKAGSGKDEDGKDAEEEEKKVEVRIDFKDIDKRLHRLTEFPGSESHPLVSQDGTEFVFVSDTDGKRDLWKIRWDGTEPERLTQGGASPRNVQWGEKGETLFYLKSGGTIASVPLAGGGGETYGYESEMKIDRFEERRDVFDEAWRDLQANYYDEDLHGANWDSVRAKYRPWAEAASTYEDFQDVLKMVLGELRSSHVNLWGGPGDVGDDLLAGGDEDADRPGLETEPMGPPGMQPPRPPDPSLAMDAAGSDLNAETGELGVVFDPHFAGPGARVGYVTPKSPADRVESRLQAGDVILSINGREAGPPANLAELLDRTVDKKTVLRVRNEKGDEREVVIRPISSRDFRQLAYRADVEVRRRYVAGAGGGRLAYVHLASMDASNLNTFERDLYAEAHGKDALLVDVRDNVGGWICDLLLTSLMAPDHAWTVPRGGGKGYPQDRRLLFAWTKPVVVLFNEYSFSNAEIFSWAIRTLHRGPTVGQQTYGGVISTGGTYLKDGSWLRLPFRGWWSRTDGTLMERFGCAPDVPVENPPGDLGAGRDPQLARAVEKAISLIEE